MYISRALLTGIAFFSILLSVAGQDDGQATKNPDIRSAFAPVYPEGARAAGAQGSVTVKLTISGDGTVQSAKYVTGNKLFSVAVEKAGEKWVFVESTDGPSREAVITFTFVLLPAGSPPEDEGTLFSKPGVVEIKKRAPIVRQVKSTRK